MTHVRQQIREAAAAALVGQTNAQDNVHSSLVYPHDDDNLPLIHVRCDSEVSELGQLGGRLSREMTLRIQAFVGADERMIDNDLDGIAAQIEAQIGGNQFSSAAKQTVLTETTIERSSEGARPIASITLDFVVVYHTDDSNGEVAL